MGAVAIGPSPPPRRSASCSWTPAVSSSSFDGLTTTAGRLSAISFWKRMSSSPAIITATTTITAPIAGCTTALRRASGEISRRPPSISP